MRVWHIFTRSGRMAIGALALFVALGFLGCGPDVDLPEEPPQVSPDSTAEGRVRAMVQARYEAMNSGNGAEYATFFGPGAVSRDDPELAEEDPGRIDDMVNALAASGARVVDMEGDVDVLDVADGPQGWTVRYKETFRIWNEVNGAVVDEPGVGVNTRVAFVEYRGSTLLVTSLLPHHPAEASPSAVLTDEPPVISPRDVGAPALREGVDQAVPIKKPSKGNPLQVCFPYNAGAAKAYADAYAYDYNIPTFRTFAPNDCANFVSQALLAGGRPMGWGFYQWDWNWWYLAAAGTQTYSWTSAKHLFNNLAQYTPSQIIGSVLNIQVGDLIFADWTSNGVIDHVMIVAQKMAGGLFSSVLIDGHTTDRWLYSMANVDAANPNDSFYAIRPVFACD